MKYCKENKRRGCDKCKDCKCDGPGKSRFRNACKIEEFPKDIVSVPDEKNTGVIERTLWKAVEMFTLKNKRLKNRDDSSRGYTKKKISKSSMWHKKTTSNKNDSSRNTQGNGSESRSITVKSTNNNINLNSLEESLGAKIAQKPNKREQAENNIIKKMQAEHNAASYSPRVTQITLNSQLDNAKVLTGPSGVGTNRMFGDATSGNFEFAELQRQFWLREAYEYNQNRKAASESQEELMQITRKYLQRMKSNESASSKELISSELLRLYELADYHRKKNMQKKQDRLNSLVKQTLIDKDHKRDNEFNKHNQHQNWDADLRSEQILLSTRHTIKCGDIDKKRQKENIYSSRLLHCDSEDTRSNKMKQTRKHLENKKKRRKRELHGVVSIDRYPKSNSTIFRCKSRNEKNINFSSMDTEQDDLVINKHCSNTDFSSLKRLYEKEIKKAQLDRANMFDRGNVCFQHSKDSILRNRRKVNVTSKVDCSIQKSSCGKESSDLKILHEAINAIGNIGSIKTSTESLNTDNQHEYPNNIKAPKQEKVQTKKKRWWKNNSKDRTSKQNKGDAIKKQLIREMTNENYNADKSNSDEVADFETTVKHSVAEQNTTDEVSAEKKTKSKKEKKREKQQKRKEKKMKQKITKKDKSKTAVLKDTMEPISDIVDSTEKEKSGSKRFFKHFSKITRKNPISIKTHSTSKNNSRNAKEVENKPNASSTMPPDYGKSPVPQIEEDNKLQQKNQYSTIFTVHNRTHVKTHTRECLNRRSGNQRRNKYTQRDVGICTDFTWTQLLKCYRDKFYEMKQNLFLSKMKKQSCIQRACNANSCPMYCKNKQNTITRALDTRQLHLKRSGELCIHPCVKTDDFGQDTNLDYTTNGCIPDKKSFGVQNSYNLKNCACQTCPRCLQNMLCYEHEQSNTIQSPPLPALKPCNNPPSAQVTNNDDNYEIVISRQPRECQTQPVCDDTSEDIRADPCPPQQIRDSPPKYDAKPEIRYDPCLPQKQRVCPTPQPKTELRYDPCPPKPCPPKPCPPKPCPPPKIEICYDPCPPKPPPKPCPPPKIEICYDPCPPKPSSPKPCPPPKTEITCDPCPPKPCPPPKPREFRKPTPRECPPPQPKCDVETEPYVPILPQRQCDCPPVDEPVCVEEPVPEEVCDPVPEKVLCDNPPSAQVKYDSKPEVCDLSTKRLCDCSPVRDDKPEANYDTSPPQIPLDTTRYKSTQSQKYDDKPDTIYDERLPPSSYNQKPPQTSFDQAPRQASYDEKPLQLNYDQRPPQTNYDQKPPQKTFDEKPPQVYYDQKPPPTNNYQKPSQTNYDQSPTQINYDQRFPQTNYDQKYPQTCPPPINYDQKPPQARYDQKSPQTCPPPINYDQKPPQARYDQKSPQTCPPPINYDQIPPQTRYDQKPPQIICPPPINYDQKHPQTRYDQKPPQTRYEQKPPQTCPPPINCVQKPPQICPPPLNFNQPPPQINYDQKPAQRPGGYQQPPQPQYNDKPGVYYEQKPNVCPPLVQPQYGEKPGICNDQRKVSYPPPLPPQYDKPGVCFDQKLNVCLPPVQPQYGEKPGICNDQRKGGYPPPLPPQYDKPGLCLDQKPNVYPPQSQYNDIPGDCQPQSQPQYNAPDVCYDQNQSVFPPQIQPEYERPCCMNPPRCCDGDAPKKPTRKKKARVERKKKRRPQDCYDDNCENRCCKRKKSKCISASSQVPPDQMVTPYPQICSTPYPQISPTPYPQSVNNRNTNDCDDNTCPRIAKIAPRGNYRSEGSSRNRGWQGADAMSDNNSNGSDCCICSSTPSDSTSVNDSDCCSCAFDRSDKKKPYSVYSGLTQSFSSFDSYCIKTHKYYEPETISRSNEIIKGVHDYSNWRKDERQSQTKKYYSEAMGTSHFMDTDRFNNNASNTNEMHGRHHNTPVNHGNYRWNQEYGQRQTKRKCGQNLPNDGRYDNYNVNKNCIHKTRYFDKQIFNNSILPQEQSNVDKIPTRKDTEKDLPTVNCPDLLKMSLSADSVKCESNTCLLIKNTAMGLQISFTHPEDNNGTDLNLNNDRIFSNNTPLMDLKQSISYCKSELLDSIMNSGKYINKMIESKHSSYKWDISKKNAPYPNKSDSIVQSDTRKRQDPYINYQHKREKERKTKLHLENNIVRQNLCHDFVTNPKSQDKNILKNQLHNENKQRQKFHSGDSEKNKLYDDVQRTKKIIDDIDLTIDNNVRSAYSDSLSCKSIESLSLPPRRHRYDLLNSFLYLNTSFINFTTKQSTDANWITDNEHQHKDQGISTMSNSYIMERNFSLYKRKPQEIRNYRTESLIPSESEITHLMLTTNKLSLKQKDKIETTIFQDQKSQDLSPSKVKSNCLNVNSNYSVNVFLFDTQDTKDTCASNYSKAIKVAVMETQQRFHFDDACTTIKDKCYSSHCFEDVPRIGSGLRTTVGTARVCKIKSSVSEHATDIQRKCTEGDTQGKCCSCINNKSGIFEFPTRTLLEKESAHYHDYRQNINKKGTTLIEKSIQHNMKWMQYSSSLKLKSSRSLYKPPDVINLCYNCTTLPANCRCNICTSRQPQTFLIEEIIPSSQDLETFHSSECSFNNGIHPRKIINSVPQTKNYYEIEPCKFKENTESIVLQINDDTAQFNEDDAHCLLRERKKEKKKFAGFLSKMKKFVNKKCCTPAEEKPLKRSIGATLADQVVSVAKNEVEFPTSSGSSYSRSSKSTDRLQTLNELDDKTEMELSSNMQNTVRCMDVYRSDGTEVKTDADNKSKDIDRACSDTTVCKSIGGKLVARVASIAMHSVCCILNGHGATENSRASCTCNAGNFFGGILADRVETLVEDTVTFVLDGCTIEKCCNKIGNISCSIYDTIQCISAIPGDIINEKTGNSAVSCQTDYIGSISAEPCDELVINEVNPNYELDPTPPTASCGCNTQADENSDDKSCGCNTTEIDEEKPKQNISCTCDKSQIDQEPYSKIKPEPVDKPNGAEKTTDGNDVGPTETSPEEKDSSVSKPDDPPSEPDDKSPADEGTTDDKPEDPIPALIPCECNNTQTGEKKTDDKPNDLVPKKDKKTFLSRMSRKRKEKKKDRDKATDKSIPPIAPCACNNAQTDEDKPDDKPIDPIPPPMSCTCTSQKVQKPDDSPSVPDDKSPAKEETNDNKPEDPKPPVVSCACNNTQTDEQKPNDKAIDPTPPSMSCKCTSQKVEEPDDSTSVSDDKSPAEEETTDDKPEDPLPPSVPDDKSPTEEETTDNTPEKPIPPVVSCACNTETDEKTPNNNNNKPIDPTPPPISCTCASQKVNKLDNTPEKPIPPVVSCACNTQTGEENHNNKPNDLAPPPISCTCASEKNKKPDNTPKKPIAPVVSCACNTQTDEEKPNDKPINPIPPLISCTCASKNVEESDNKLEDPIPPVISCACNTQTDEEKPDNRPNDPTPPPISCKCASQKNKKPEKAIPPVVSCACNTQTDEENPNDKPIKHAPPPISCTCESEEVEESYNKPKDSMPPVMSCACNTRTSEEKPNEIQNYFVPQRTSCECAQSNDRPARAHLERPKRPDDSFIKTSRYDDILEVCYDPMWSSTIPLTQCDFIPGPKTPSILYKPCENHVCKPARYYYDETENNCDPILSPRPGDNQLSKSPTYNGKYENIEVTDALEPSKCLPREQRKYKDATEIHYDPSYLHNPHENICKQSRYNDQPEKTYNPILQRAEYLPFSSPMRYNCKYDHKSTAPCEPCQFLIREQTKYDEKCNKYYEPSYVYTPCENLIRSTRLSRFNENYEPSAPLQRHKYTPKERNRYEDKSQSLYDPSYLYKPSDDLLVSPKCNNDQPENTHGTQRIGNFPLSKPFIYNGEYDNYESMAPLRHLPGEQTRGNNKFDIGYDKLLPEISFDYPQKGRARYNDQRESPHDRLLLQKPCGQSSIHYDTPVKLYDPILQQKQTLYAPETLTKYDKSELFIKTPEKPKKYIDPTPPQRPGDYSQTQHTKYEGKTDFSYGPSFSFIPCENRPVPPMCNKPEKYYDQIPVQISDDNYNSALPFKQFDYISREPTIFNDESELNNDFSFRKEIYEQSNYDDNLVEGNDPTPLHRHGDYLPNSKQNKNETADNYEDFCNRSNKIKKERRKRDRRQNKNKTEDKFEDICTGSKRKQIKCGPYKCKFQTPPILEFHPCPYINNEDTSKNNNSYCNRKICPCVAENQVKCEDHSQTETESCDISSDTELDLDDAGPYVCSTRQHNWNSTHHSNSRLNCKAKKTNIRPKKNRHKNFKCQMDGSKLKRRKTACCQAEFESECSTRKKSIVMNKSRPIRSKTRSCQTVCALPKRGRKKRKKQKKIKKNKCKPCSCHTARSEPKRCTCREIPGTRKVQSSEFTPFYKSGADSNMCPDCFGKLNEIMSISSPCLLQRTTCQCTKNMHPKHHFGRQHIIGAVHTPYLRKRCNRSSSDTFSKFNCSDNYPSIHTSDIWRYSNNKEKTKYIIKGMGSYVCRAYKGIRNGLQELGLCFGCSLLNTRFVVNCSSHQGCHTCFRVNPFGRKRRWC